MSRARASRARRRPRSPLTTPVRLARRRIGGMMFEAVEPGTWLSEDYRLAIVHVMQGTEHECWELYETQLGAGDADEPPADVSDVDFLMHRHVCGSPNLGDRGIADAVAARAR